jgi:hypothetical protein
MYSAMPLLLNLLRVHNEVQRDSTELSLAVPFQQDTQGCHACWEYLFLRGRKVNFQGFLFSQRKRKSYCGEVKVQLEDEAMHPLCAWRNARPRLPVA